MTLTPDDVKKITSGTARRAMLNNSRGAINTVKDSGNIQIVQATLLDEEIRDKVERIQEFGFTSNPPADSDCVFVAIGGNRDHLIAIATDSRQYRKKSLEPGEVCIYDKKGSEIYLKKNGDIEIKPNGKVKIIGDLEVSGEIKQGTLLTKFSTHTHPTGTGPSGPPVGGS